MAGRHRLADGEETPASPSPSSRRPKARTGSTRASTNTGSDARAAGIPYAPYHFYYFCSTADEQADWFIHNVPKNAMLPAAGARRRMERRIEDLPLPARSPVTVRDRNASASWTGWKPITASGRSSIPRSISTATISSASSRTIISGSVRSPSIREVIYADRRWAFWQYTSTGVIPGIKGPTRHQRLCRFAQRTGTTGSQPFRRTEIRSNVRRSFLLPSHSSVKATPFFRI